MNTPRQPRCAQPLGIDGLIDTAMLRTFAESPLHDDATTRVLHAAADEIDQLRDLARWFQEYDGGIEGL